MTGLRIGGLFAGYSGLEMGVQSVLGGEIAWHSEIDPGACKILAHRYPDVPNLGDITTVDWSQVEPVDVLTGGFPCQDVSCAGLRKGLRPDTRSGLWTQFAYPIDQLRPELVVIENVRGLLSAAAHSDLEPCPWCVGDGGGVPLRALGAVLGDLADIGYDASWTGLRAADIGAPHGRFRVFVVAWPVAHPGDGPGELERSRPAPGGRGATADPGCLRGQQGRVAAPGQAQGRRSLAVLGECRRVDVAAHPTGDGRHEGRTEPAGLLGGSDAALSGDGDADRRGPIDWGVYGPAVHRWERLTRPAPSPTEPGAKGGQRLSPAFVEWLMGLSVGWVTDVPGITRNEALKALGNGVVPQQCAAALRILLAEQLTERAA